MKNTFAFASESITVNGIQFPASYSVSAKSGDVYVFAIVKPSADEPDMPVRIHIASGMPMHAEALAAAQAVKAPKGSPVSEPEVAPAEKADVAPAPVADPAPVDKPADKPAEKPARKAKAPRAAKPAKAEPAPKAADPAPVDKPADKPARKAKAPKAAKPAKAEPAPAPKAEPVANAGKPWIGTRIEGAGWHIAFDADAGRTRVVFADAPSAAQKSAIEAAGFFWSAQLKSWNKKLTCKAYRAAQALAADLAALA